MDNFMKRSPAANSNSKRNALHLTTAGHFFLFTKYSGQPGVLTWRTRDEA